MCAFFEIEVNNFDVRNFQVLNLCIFVEISLYVYFEQYNLSFFYLCVYEFTHILLHGDISTQSPFLSDMQLVSIQKFPGPFKTIEKKHVKILLKSFFPIDDFRLKVIYMKSILVERKQ